MASLESAARFTWRRLAITVLVSAAVLAAGTYFVRSYPTSGYDAGYAAVMEHGETAVRESVDAAAGDALPLCANLFDETDRQAGEPHYDRRSFLDGCRSAVEELAGRTVTLDAR